MFASKAANDKDVLTSNLRCSGFLSGSVEMTLGTNTGGYRRADWGRKKESGQSKSVIRFVSLFFFWRSSTNVSTRIKTKSSCTTIQVEILRKCRVVSTTG